jgi:hypothetical protein
MLPVPAIKLGAQILGGLGSAKIVNDIIRNHVIVNTTADAVKVWAGSFVISGMIIEQSSSYIDRLTKEVTEFIASRKVVVEEPKVAG